MKMEKVEIAPTNLIKFNKAIEKVSEASGLLQTSGLAFKVTRPIVTKLMEVLEELSELHSNLEVVASGKGRRAGEAGPESSEVLTPDELARLEVEATGVVPPNIPWSDRNGLKPNRDLSNGGANVN